MNDKKTDLTCQALRLSCFTAASVATATQPLQPINLPSSEGTRERSLANCIPGKRLLFAERFMTLARDYSIYIYIYIVYSICRPAPGGSA